MALKLTHFLPFFFLLLLQLQLLAHTCIATSSNHQSPIIIQPYIIDYRNGTITRYITTPNTGVPPPNDNQVQSKDIFIPSKPNLRARAFLPAHPHPARKLPILIYFHGGAFCIGSPFLWGDSHYVARVAAEAHVLAIAVDYRLFPEFTIPAPYDDAWTALNWVMGHASGRAHEPWVAQYGDLNSVFVGGDSSGGNIAHNLAIRAGLGAAPRFKGLFLAMPYFLGKRRVPLEPKWFTASPNFKIWAYLCPHCRAGVDSGYINPFGPEAPKLARLGCKKLLVYTAEVDELRGRGIWYYKKVKRSKWAGQAQWIEARGKKHVFHISEPEDPATNKMIQDLSTFLNAK